MLILDFFPFFSDVYSFITFSVNVATFCSLLSCTDGRTCVNPLLRWGERRRGRKCNTSLDLHVILTDALSWPPLQRQLLEGSWRLDFVSFWHPTWRIYPFAFTPERRCAVTCPERRRLANWFLSLWFGPTSWLLHLLQLKENGKWRQDFQGVLRLRFLLILRPHFFSALLAETEKKIQAIVVVIDLIRTRNIFDEVTTEKYYMYWQLSYQHNIALNSLL